LTIRQVPPDPGDDFDQPILIDEDDVVLKGHGRAGT